MSVSLQHVLPFKCLSWTRISAPVARVKVFDLCNHRVPEYLTRISSCKACTTHSTCLRYSRIPALTAGGCDPPSLSLNLKTSISQLVTCQPPRQIPGSLLHAFARRGENRRRRVSVKAVLSSKERIGQKISNVSRRAASLPVIGCAECRKIRSEGEPSLDLRPSEIA